MGDGCWLKMDAAEVIRTVMRVLELFVAVRERAGAVAIRDAAVKLAALADSHDCSATKEKSWFACLLISFLIRTGSRSCILL